MITQEQLQRDVAARLTPPEEAFTFNPVIDQLIATAEPLRQTDTAEIREGAYHQIVDDYIRQDSGNNDSAVANSGLVRDYEQSDNFEEHLVAEGVGKYSMVEQTDRTGILVAEDTPLETDFSHTTRTSEVSIVDYQDPSRSYEETTITENTAIETELAQVSLNHFESGDYKSTRLELLLGEGTDIALENYGVDGSDFISAGAQVLFQPLPLAPAVPVSNGGFILDSIEDSRTFTEQPGSVFGNVLNVDSALFPISSGDPSPVLYLLPTL